MRIAGLDIGTTGCKLTVFDGEGTYLDKAYREYPVSRKRGEHEVDAEVILRDVLGVIQTMAAKYPDISGIGVTSFGETFVMTDETGKPLHPAMLYTDPRGEEECREMTDKLGEMEITSMTGLRPHKMYSISKMMWIKEHRPQIYTEARHIFLMEDYIVYHLTGKAQIDYSLAARTMAFDIKSLKWSKKIFQAAGIDVGLMSKTVPTGTSAGVILPDVAALTGLGRQTQIISVSHDQMAAAVGAGAFGTETAVDGAGTVECISMIHEGLPNMEVMYRGSYAVVPYVIPGKYICYAFSYTGGALIQWCVDHFAKQEKETAKQQGISVNEMLEKPGESPTGILVLPHFAGAATPYMDSGAKGAVIGLTVEHGLGDLYRACMEGVVYEMLLNMEYLEGSGIQFDMLHATGGGAKSEVWMQMKADMMNIPITALKTADAGTVGSAMLTGIAAGCFKDLRDAAGHMIEKKTVYRPDAVMHERYMSVYRRYKEVYQAVRPLI